MTIGMVPSAPGRTAASRRLRDQEDSRIRKPPGKAFTAGHELPGAVQRGGDFDRLSQARTASTDERIRESLAIRIIYVAQFPP